MYSVSIHTRILCFIFFCVANISHHSFQSGGVFNTRLRSKTRVHVIFGPNTAGCIVPDKRMYNFFFRKSNVREKMTVKNVKH